MISVFFKVLLPVLLILALGFAVGKHFEIHRKTLSTLSLYILTPCLIFQALYPYENLFSLLTLKIFGALTALTLIVVILVEVFGRIFHVPKSIRLAFALTLSIANTGNFGLPINEYAYGAEALITASLVMVIYGIFTNSIGVFLASWNKGSAKDAVKELFRLPFVYVLILALSLNFLEVKIPETLFDSVQKVGLAAIPINLIQLGINLAQVDFSKLKEIYKSVGLAALFKLILIPIAGFFMMKSLGLQGSNLQAVVTQIAMPPAVYCSILASHYDTDVELTSSIVFVNTLLSLITLSAWIWFLG